MLEGTVYIRQNLKAAFYLCYGYTYVNTFATKIKPFIGIFIPRLGSSARLNSFMNVVNVGNRITITTCLV